ncbi:MAG: hypothetical protein KDC80_19675, partial [Saprospiraceae bacterium]|nr:hypothetical protein [Saprospiraceae bacterium]
VIEPTFQYYHSEVKKEQDIGNIVANYSFIDFPAGLRYYSFLKNQRQLFFNALYISNFSVNFGSSAITYPTRPYDKKLEISTRNSFAVGAGMKFTKKFSVELRYYFDRKIIGDYLSWDSTFTRLALIAGYRFFTSEKD